VYDIPIIDSYDNMYMRYSQYHWPLLKQLEGYPPHFVTIPPLAALKAIVKNTV